MSTTETQHSPVHAVAITTTGSLKSHSLAYLEDPDNGIRVPVTEITLEPSPNGEANTPLQVYRTAGPGSDPIVGLEPFRSSWIEGRGDTEPYSGRERNLLDDGARPHTPKRWVSMLESRAELRRIYEGLASLGIVDQVGERRLGLFGRTRYPEKNHAPEAALLERVGSALRGGSADPRTRALTALLYSAELLGKIFPGVDQGHARELAHNYWPSRAVAAELRKIRLAEAEPAT